MADTTQLPDASATDAAFNDAFSAPVAPGAQAGAAPAPAAAPDATPSDVNVINPRGEVVAIPHSYLQQAINSGYQPATDDQVEKHFRAEKYGTLGEQVKTGLEGAASAATFGLSTGVERALGVDPNDINQRAAENPLSHSAGELGGLAASSLIPGVGAAGLLGKAGEGAAAMAGLGGGKFISQIGAEAVNAAVQGAIYQGGSEVSKYLANDPEQTAQSALHDIGLSALLGGAFGVGFGLLGKGAKAGLQKAGILAHDAPEAAAAEATTVNPEAGTPAYHEPSVGSPGTFVSEMDIPKMEQGDLATTIKYSDEIPQAEKDSLLARLGKEHKEADAVREAFERQGLSDVPEAFTTDSVEVEHAVDNLLRGNRPTFSGIRQRARYQTAFEGGVKNPIEEVVGTGEAPTLRETGETIQDNLVKKLEAANAPIKAAYESIRERHSLIPVDGVEEAQEAFKRIQATPGTPQGKLVKNFGKALENLKTANDVKQLNTEMWQSLSPTASGAEKSAVAQMSDALKKLENGSVERFAKNLPEGDEARAFFESTVRERVAANDATKKLMADIGDVAEKLGKSRPRGIQDTINFIRDHLTGEEVVNKLFSKKDSAFLESFAKKFPEEMKTLSTYQKAALREKALINGELSPAKFHTALGKLEPEVRNVLFSPEELQKLADSKLILDHMPRNFNPSGTSHSSALQELFHSPLGLARANVGDALQEAFIKHKDLSRMAQESPQVQAALDYGKAAAKGAKTAQAGVAAVFNFNMKVPAALTVSDSKINSLKAHVEAAAADPNRLAGVGSKAPVGAAGVAFAQTAANAVQYLQNLRQQHQLQQNPLDPKLPTSKVNEAQYRRALQIAQQPLTVLKSLKEGTLTPNDIQHLQALAPKTFEKLQQDLMNAMTDAISKGKAIPYKTRMGLSMFLGQTLDSTMTPQAIQSAQPKPPQMQPATATTPATGPRHSASALNKLPGAAMTPLQQRQDRRE